MDNKTFSLQIRTDGPTFHTEQASKLGPVYTPGAELARILRSLADDLEHETSVALLEGIVLFDDNEELVGEAGLE